MWVNLRRKKNQRKNQRSGKLKSVDPLHHHVSSSASPVSSSASPSSTPSPATVVAAVGFPSLIDGFGEPFKNSRSRKSIVFVPNEKALPLKGWKSLRNAGLSSKKVGKILKNGDSIVHTSKAGNDGHMYFLNNNAWGSLKRKKKIVMED
jgi:hypothetical protein